MWSSYYPHRPTSSHFLPYQTCCLRSYRAVRTKQNRPERGEEKERKGEWENGRRGSRTARSLGESLRGNLSHFCLLQTNRWGKRCFEQCPTFDPRGDSLFDRLFAGIHAMKQCSCSCSFSPCAASLLWLWLWWL